MFRLGFTTAPAREMLCEPGAGITGAGTLRSAFTTAPSMVIVCGPAEALASAPMLGRLTVWIAPISGYVAI